jgi:uncharacterized membrane protein YfcA
MHSGSIEPTVLIGIGLIGSFFSGLLGIGGAIILIPMLLYAPPMFGFVPPNMAAIGGMSIVQITVASLLSLVVHGRSGHFSRRAAVPMASAIAVGAAIGGVASKFVPDASLRGLFAITALLAAGLMFLPSRADEEDSTMPDDFRPGLAALIAGAVGVVSGLLGAGGAFLLAPIMRTLLRLPLRIVIGTSLAVVLTSSIVSLIAKAATNQIPWEPTLFLVAGSLVGAPLGAVASKRIKVGILRWILATAIVVTAVRMAWQIWG